LLKKRIAIIGAGISGLTLARSLEKDSDVVVFEKARGVSGRMSTRFAAPFFFDHGAQFFTARTQRFKDFLQPYILSGTIKEWAGKIITLEAGKKITKSMWFEPHFVASPNMNSLCKKIAEGMNVQLNCEIVSICKENADWYLMDQAGHTLGTFDWVISTAPPAQTTHLFERDLPFSAPVRSIKMNACFSLMIGFTNPWKKHWIAANVRNSPVRWIAINSTKPDRVSDLTAIVVHSNNAWAESHKEDDLKSVEMTLLKEFESLTDMESNKAAHISIHRWKYAMYDGSESLEFYLDAEKQMAATGDWAAASRIEEAWSNADRLASRILTSIY